MNTIDNKRLAIDFMALRQLVLAIDFMAQRQVVRERGGERQQFIDHSSGDYPRWIDTSTMLADPLTKAMDCKRHKERRTAKYKQAASALIHTPPGPQSYEDDPGIPSVRSSPYEIQGMPI